MHIKIRSIFFLHLICMKLEISRLPFFSFLHEEWSFFRSWMLKRKHIILIKEIFLTGA